MKRIILCCLFALILLTTACGKSEKITKKPTSNMDVISPETSDEIPVPTKVPVMVEYEGKEYPQVEVSVDRILYNSFEELEDKATLVVIGTFTNEVDTVVSTYYDEELKKNLYLDGYTTCKLKVLQVLKGECAEEYINIAEKYVFYEEIPQYIVSTELTPMKEGTTWIYFLADPDAKGNFWALGDYTGRFPHMAIDEEKLNNNEYTEEELGVRNPNVFKYQVYPIYKEMIEHYNISFK